MGESLSVDFAARLAQPKSKYSKKLVKSQKKD